MGYYITFTEMDEVSRMLNGLLKGYKAMMKARGKTDGEIEIGLNKMIGFEKKSFWSFLRK